MHLIWPCLSTVFGSFFTQHNHVTFGSLLLQLQLSSVTFVHPTQRFNFSSGMSNARQVANYNNSAQLKLMHI